MRNSIVRLLNCYMLDSSYNHTVNFKSRTSQIDWFLKKTVLNISDTSYQRISDNIRVNYSLSDLDNCNYVMTKNENENWRYYFIIDKVYVNENMTILVCKLDVFQTFYFDIDFRKYESFIDRQHVYRWNGNLPNMIDLDIAENLEIGEYVVNKRETLYNYRDKGGYIVTASDKLSKKTSTPSSGGGELSSYEISKNYLLYLKQAEGFASSPYDIGDGTRTTGYGCTEVYQPTYFNQLLPTCTEEQATKVTLAMLENFISGVKSACGSKRPTQSQFDSMVDYAYNCGVGGLSSSDWFNAWLNGKSNSEVAAILEHENITFPGHVSRRKIESEMFLGNYPTFTKISDVTNGGYVTDNNGQGYIPSNMN